MAEGKLEKREYNRLVKKIQTDQQKLMQQKETLTKQVESAHKGEAWQQETRYELDTRKMAIMATLQDHVMICRRYVLGRFQSIMQELLISKLKQHHNGTDETFAGKIQKRIANLNMQKIATRLFDQGGYIYKDDSSLEYIVVMRDYKIPLMQEVYEKLCLEFSRYSTAIESGNIMYTLHFLTEDAFRGKYANHIKFQKAAIAQPLTCNNWIYRLSA